MLVSRAERSYQPIFGDPLLESWRWRTFAEMHGLETQCLVQGTDGTLWFGAMDGLSSYDGFTWSRHLARDDGILAGWVATMAVEPDGALDVAGWWGISQWKDGAWTRLVPDLGVRFANVRKLAVAPDGTVWAATSWGALCRRGASWTLYTSPAHAARLAADERYRVLQCVVVPREVLERQRRGGMAHDRTDLFDVACDVRGDVWFGTQSGELLQLRGVAADRAGTWTLHNEDDGVVHGRQPALLTLGGGMVWAVLAQDEKSGGPGGGVVFDGRTWRDLEIPAPGVQGDGAQLLQTRDGVIWVSARYVLFAYSEGAWRTYTRPAVPLPQARNLLLQSADGALWIAGPSTDTQRVDYQTPRWTTLQDLNFQWESPQGRQWFIHRGGRVVARLSDAWTSYGVEDGLMDAPVALLGARDGSVWVAGSHESIASTARFDGKTWTRAVHAQFSWGVDSRALFEASDGSMWFGAAVDSRGPADHRAGILQYRDGRWIHHHQPGRSPRPDGADLAPTLLPANHRPEPIEKYALIGESRDGRIWAGRNVLVVHDGSSWSEPPVHDELRMGIIESMLTTADRGLWIGTRQYGAFHYSGSAWQHHQGKDSLRGNSVRSLAQTRDGSIWAATDRGFSRFDGNTWMDAALPAALAFPHDGGALKAAASGSLWLNSYTVNWNQRAWAGARPPAPDAPFRTICHQFSEWTPRTTITSGPDIVSHPGNISILWSGEERWREPEDVRLQFSHRLDGGAWSPFTSDRGRAFFTLPSGRHRFEVRARDQDFNVDPRPAVLEFAVLPPVWRQAWFLLLMCLLGALLVVLSVRVVLQKQRLQVAHDRLDDRVRQRTAELEMANRELESFSYSVSHDLRAPLRSIDGFSRILEEDYHAKLDDEGRENLHHIRAAAQRMGHLIDAMLQLSRVTRGTLRRASVNLSELAREIAADLARHDAEGKVEVAIAPDVAAVGDPALLRNVLENLLGNAWKFSSRRPGARIEFGVAERSGEVIYFVRDNGAGFDRASARNLFGAFQRFHTMSEFPGTGVGLATVQRIIHRHGGRLEAESRPGEGAMFFFTLPQVQADSE